jgi:hypothetical protein
MQSHLLHVANLHHEAEQSVKLMEFKQKRDDTTGKDPRRSYAPASPTAERTGRTSRSLSTEEIIPFALSEIDMHLLETVLTILYDTEQRTSIRRTTASKRVGIMLWWFLEFLGLIVFIAIILIEVASQRAQVRRRG